MADGEAQGFEQDDIDLDKTVAGMLSIRDVPGPDPNDPMAHGSGFDRVAAFQDGYENGPERLRAYADPDVDRPTVELEFDRTEASTGGDLPLEDDWDGQGSQGLLSLVEQDLNAYYAQLFDELGEQFTPVDDLVIVDSTASVSCGDDQLSADEIDYAAFYCVDDNTIVLGAELIELLHQDIGDFAVASEIALLWAAAAQQQLGVEPGSEAALQADCLTGSWGSWTYPDDTPPSSEVLRISGGDLDEGIMAFLAYASEDSDTTVFDRSEALRTGFFEGYDACEEYGPLGYALRGRTGLRPTAAHVPRREQADRSHADDDGDEHRDLQRTAAVAGLGGLVARVRLGDDVLVGDDGLRVLALVVGASAGAVVSGRVGLLVRRGRHGRAGQHGHRRQRERGQEDGEASTHAAMVRSRRRPGQTDPNAKLASLSDRQGTEGRQFARNGGQAGGA